MKAMFLKYLNVFVVLCVYCYTGVAQDNMQKFANPVFPGGQDAMNRYLSESLVYPESRSYLYTSGLFKVPLVIEKDGKVSLSSELNSGDATIDSIVVDLVAGFPDFEPALLNDSAIRVTINLPLRIGPPVREKGIADFNGAFVDFKYHKKAKVLFDSTFVKIDGNFSGGIIIFKKETSDFDVSEKTNEIFSEYEGVTVWESFIEHTILSGYKAIVSIARIRFNPSVNRLIGEMIIKVYKIKVEDQVYSISTIDFDEDMYRKYESNALIMTSFIFKNGKGK